VKVSAILVLALGVIGIICAVSIGKNDLMVSSVQETKNTIMGVTIAFSVFLIILGLAGAFGAWKNNGCALAIYNIGIGIFFVAFLIISIVAFAVFKKYTNVDVTNVDVCKSQSWLNPINNMAVQGENYLCSSACACNASLPLSWTSVFAKTNATVNTSTTNTSAGNTSNASSADDEADSNGTSASNRTYNYSSNGSIRVQDCPNYQKDFGLAQRELGVTLELLEREFQCAGICQNGDFFAFSNINGGTPKNDCATVLVDVFVSYSKKIGAATIVMTILLFLTLVASFCLCCHPDKRNKEGGFYSKMTSM